MSYFETLPTLHPCCEGLQCTPKSPGVKPCCSDCRDKAMKEQDLGQAFDREAGKVSPYGSPWGA